MFEDVSGSSYERHERLSAGCSSERASRLVSAGPVASNGAGGGGGQNDVVPLNTVIFFFFAILQQSSLNEREHKQLFKRIRKKFVSYINVTSTPRCRIYI